MGNCGGNNNWASPTRYKGNCGCDDCCNQPKIKYCGKDLDCVTVENGDCIDTVIEKLGDRICDILNTAGGKPWIDIQVATSGQCPEGGYVIQAKDPVTDAVIEEAVVCIGVQSVTGNVVDNTDPLNPIVNVFVDQETITGSGTEEDPFVANTGESCCNPVLFTYGWYRENQTIHSSSNLPDYEYEILEQDMPVLGDYINVRINLYVLSGSGEFGLTYDSADFLPVSYPILASATTGNYHIDTRLVRTDSNSAAQGFPLHVNTYNTANKEGEYPNFGVSGNTDIKLPFKLRPYFSVGAGGGSIIITDYSITPFKQ